MSSTRFDPMASSAPLIVYIDYKSPYAYLAKDPTYAMADELGIEIDWRPFTLDIPSYLGSARLDQQGRVVESRRTARQWSKVKYAYRDARRYASMRGLVVRGTTKIWDSSLAGVGMLWAKNQGASVLRAYTDLVYERFWKRELDIEDAGVIEGVLGEAGVQTAGFRAYLAGEGRALHDHIQQAAFDAGIFGVPTYVIAKEIFFGREHLPRVRWLLSGRRGAPPDVAYETGNPNALVAGGVSSKVLSVVIDFNSPQAYLALKPTRALAEEMGVGLDWQPLVTPARKAPAAASAGDDRGTRHRRIRSQYLERDVMRYAADRGLVVRGLYAQIDSTSAALGLLWVKRERPSLAWDYVKRVFDSRWGETLDIGDEQAIGQLLVEIGAPAAGFEKFAAGPGRAELEKIQLELQEADVYEAPAYRVNNELFIGRQHLPLIRCLLSKE